MTVGEMIDELRKYGPRDLCRFFSKNGDEEFVRLVCWAKGRVFLTPHGERILTNSDLIKLFQESDFKAHVYFLTQANEVTKISSLDVSDDYDAVILPGRN